MTRRIGGAEGAVDSAGASACSIGVGASVAGAAATGCAAGGATAGAVAVAAASTGGAAGGAGLAAGGAATAGGVAGGATDTGGRAITGPTGGLLAMAGADGGATMFACGRGCGTIRLGCAGTAVWDAVWDVAWDVTWDAVWAWAGAAAPGEATLGAAAGTDAGAATTAVGRGGAALAAASACLRSRMALRASPGLETLERSNFGLLSAGCLLAVLLLPPFLKYSRTLSAWSSSIELEWVFPVTPIASSASRIGLLLTSSSRARSLIRTLLIRPFSFLLPCALSCSYQPHGGLNLYCKCCP
jgi:hypothetical protein